MGFDAKRNVDGHLVAVKVGVESGADERVHLDCISFNKNRFESLDAEAVQGRRAVEEHVLVLDHFFQNLPDFLCLVIDEASCTANIVGELALREGL